MGRTYPLLIDAYSHIVPQDYLQLLSKVAPKEAAGKIKPLPPLYDLDARFRVMDRFEGLIQVLTLAFPAIEEVADGQRAVELARVANDSMAELVRKYPDRFVAAVACLPMDNIDAALQEAERAINELRCRGVMIYTPINDKPLDSPEFLPLYEMMAAHDLPILIHPARQINYPDYRSEEVSKYRLFTMLGWPYETSAAMTRIVFSGILEKYPGLKFVTHHCGGMIPYFAERIIQFHDSAEMRRGELHKQGLRRSPIEYYRMFYNDTALYGNTPALMLAYSFFGADHLLFGVDMPLGDNEIGFRNYRQTINAIEQMNITDAERKLLYEENARKIFRLPI